MTCEVVNHSAAWCARNLPAILLSLFSSLFTSLLPTGVWGFALGDGHEIEGFRGLSPRCTSLSKPNLMFSPTDTPDYIPPPRFPIH